MIAASPTLQAREHHTLAATADALAALLAAETNAEPHDPHPQVAANALLGVQRALVAYTRQRVLADPTPTGLVGEDRRRSAPRRGRLRAAGPRPGRLRPQMNPKAPRQGRTRPWPRLAAGLAW